MSHDQISKSLRQFHCRDYLWELFQKMSAELECSSDYLINEAMRQYAKAYQAGNLSAAPPQSQAKSMPGVASPSSANIPALGTMRSGKGSMSTGALPLPPPPARPQRPAFSPPGVSDPGALGKRQSAPASFSGSEFPAPGRESFKPASEQLFPSAGGSGYPAAGGRPTLFVIYDSQRIPVAKDEFIIGRGSKSSDLTIKDGNISRRHAAIVFENGAYYLKDLGSTNGIEFQGRRIGGKRIDEGDVFSICDYELRFTYR